MKILGAIVGDIVGSRFEWNNNKSKSFELFTDHNFVTDDTIMTLAIAKAIIECDNNYTELGSKTIFYMRKFGNKYPNSGYGSNFSRWLLSTDPKPYYSYGNGAAMRVSACGIIAKSVEEAINLSRIVTGVTHNHPEGMKGAEATAVVIYLAKIGMCMDGIRNHVSQNYYSLDFNIDEIRQEYKFSEFCQDTVPQAIEAFLESVSFEDAIRIAISLGGDSDTLAAITGSIAAAFYGIPDNIVNKTISFLDKTQIDVVVNFSRKFN